MPQQTFILCPGQGAQHVGMGRDYHAASAAVRAIFGRASEVVGFDLAQVCFDGPVERLNQTDVSQPAIYVTSVACHAAARATDKVPANAYFGYAGLSLGEYTALHLAGAFDFETGLRLVAARGRYMQEAAEATPSGMVALVGADEPTATRLCEENARGDVLVPANFNAPGQVVVSGTAEACKRLGEAASAAGLRAVPLAVAGAFHSELMRPAAERMREELARVPFAAPTADVYSNVTGATHDETNPDSIKALLVEQIVRPVRWEQNVAAMLAIPGARFIELAPGKVLTGLLKKQNRRAEVTNLATTE